MLIETRQSKQCLTIFLVGRVQWNDRLRLAQLMPELRKTTASELAVDHSQAEEIDEGSLLGLLATVERMAATEGKRLRRVSP